MPKIKVTRRNRLIALAGVAAVAAPLAFSPVFGSNSANAQSSAPQTMSTVEPSTTNKATLPDNFQPPVKSFAPIVAAVKPAVVTVTVKMKSNDASAQGMTPFEPGSPMDQFFRQFFGDNGNGNGPKGFPQIQPHQRETEALGSGFIIKSNGTIVTNNHVVANASSVKVTLDDGSSYDAKVIGTDAKTDLAVLKIDAGKDLPTVAWDDSDKLQLGDPILALGNPFGIGTTVTSGIVSARGRDLHDGPYDDFIQVDAAINHGNSGGPLVDMHGKVVGINSAIYSPNGGNVGVGFAIPSNQASAIVAKLIKNGSIERGFIGVQIQPVTEDIAGAIGLKGIDGALVASVGKGTPADKAGIKTGDVITEFNHEKVKDPRDLARRVANVQPGEHSSITVWRNGKDVEMSIDIAKYNDNMTAMNSGNDNGSQNSDQGMDVPSLGLSLSDLTPDVRKTYQIPSDENGAVISNVDPNKSAGEHGLREGDVIVAVNQQHVSSANDVQQAIKSAKKDGRKSVLLLIQRSGSQSFIALPFGNA